MAGFCHEFVRNYSPRVDTNGLKEAVLPAHINTILAIDPVGMSWGEVSVVCGPASEEQDLPGTRRRHNQPAVSEWTMDRHPEDACEEEVLSPNTYPIMGTEREIDPRTAGLMWWIYLPVRIRIYEQDSGSSKPAWNHGFLPIDTEHLAHYWLRVVSSS